jgi:hypothetical protein
MMRRDRVVPNLLFALVCAGLLAPAAHCASGRPIAVSNVPCNEDFILDNVHYVQSPDGVTGCAGDVVIGHNVRRTLDVLAVHFDTIESANLIDGVLYLNGRGSLRLADPVTQGPSRVAQFKRVTLMVRGNSGEDDGAAGPSVARYDEPQAAAPRLKPISASWSKPYGSMRPLRQPKAAMKPLKPRTGSASPDSLRGCLDLATQLKEAEDPVGGVRVFNLNDYSTGRLAVVQYGKQTGAAVLLDRTDALSPGAGLTCTSD